MKGWEMAILGLSKKMSRFLHWITFQFPLCYYYYYHYIHANKIKACSCLAEHDVGVTTTKGSRPWKCEVREEEERKKMTSIVFTHICPYSNIVGLHPLACVVFKKKSYLIIHHNIIMIQNNVMQNWQYYVENSIIHIECEEYSTKYCQFRKTIFQFWIILWQSICPRVLY